jgi:hypothetical protein
VLFKKPKKAEFMASLVELKVGSVDIQKSAAPKAAKF